MKLKFILILILVNSYCKAQYVNIPDTIFRNTLIQLYPNCFNAIQELDTSCLAIVNEVKLTAYGGIVNVDGLQYFDNLDTLNLSQNQISTFPSFPSNLRFINTYDCQLSSLPSLPNSLKVLYCNQNNLNALPLLPSGLEVLSIDHNFFSVLPQLPNNLKELICRDNQITQLPILPPTLLELDCSTNLLTSLPALPNQLYSLYCYGNLISILPPLPNSLLNFGCSDNLLINLPALPPNLQGLECGNNYLTSLPNLPNSMWNLYCSRNLLTSLPKLPDALYYLTCYNNQLTSLPILPDGLVWLYASENNLQQLPSLNNQLYSLDCHNNPLLNCLPILPKSLWFLDRSGTQITCLPNNPNNMNLWLPICELDSTCEENPYLSGIVFNDVNTNNIYDTLIDQPLYDYNVVNSNNWITNSWGDGKYLLRLDSNSTNTFYLDTNKPYFSVYPPAYNVTTNNNSSQGNNYNFAVQLFPTSLSELSINQVNYYPNPVDDFLTIEFKDKQAEIQIFDILGNLFWNGIVISKEQIDLRNLPTGIYSCYIHSKEKVSIVKIAKH